MKKITILLMLIASFASSSLFASPEKMFNLRFSPVGLIWGQGKFSGDVVLNDKIAVGPDVSYFAYGSLSSSWTIGGHIDYKLTSGDMFDSGCGWLVSPFFEYGETKMVDKDFYGANDRSKHNHKHSYFGGGFTIDYLHMFDEGFNIRVGVGPFVSSRRAAVFGWEHFGIAFNASVGYAFY